MCLPAYAPDPGRKGPEARLRSGSFDNAKKLQLLLKISTQLLVRPVELVADCIEPLAKRLFLFTLAVIPWPALQPHDDDVIADEMWMGARGEQPGVGLISTKGTKLLGGSDARTGKRHLGGGAKVRD